MRVPGGLEHLLTGDHSARVERQALEDVEFLRGEGDGAASQSGPVVGADISDWVGRLIRAVWRRFFLRGGEA